MFCPNCGKEVPENENFCSNCGKKLVDESQKKTNGKTVGMIVAVISLFLLLGVIALIGSVGFGQSPEELLVQNKWYSGLTVNCDYYEAMGEWKAGYWFSAQCYETVFYSYGESERALYRIGGYGSAYGPYSYEINEDNIPSTIEWKKEKKTHEETWEILEENTLKCDGDHYLFDDDEDTHCNCEDDDCRHEKTWYITQEYLRIGRDTYESQKPSALHPED